MLMVVESEDYPDALQEAFPEESPQKPFRYVRVHHEPTATYVSERIIYWRKQKGLSQTELGRQLGLSYQQIQKYENGGNRITVDAIAEIARVLNVPVGSFFPRLETREQSHDIFDQQIQMLKDEAAVLENIASALQSTVERLK